MVVANLLLMRGFRNNKLRKCKKLYRETEDKWAKGSSYGPLLSSNDNYLCPECGGYGYIGSKDNFCFFCGGKGFLEFDDERIEEKENVSE
jgi:hypothetical protein